MPIAETVKNGKRIFFQHHGGHPLVVGEDCGGVRWFLDGEPVHCGTGLELLFETDCIFDNETGAMTGFTPLWVRVRFEMDFGHGVIYLPTTGEAAHFNVPPTALFRWPVKRWKV